jgi:molybdate transport system substrate-binding protein
LLTADPEAGEIMMMLKKGVSCGWRRWVPRFACLLIFAGCGRAPQAPVELLCGNSFVKPMEQLCAEFTAQTGIPIAISAAGSEDFLPQVKVSRRGDILVSHDPYLDYVAEAKALGDHVQTGYVAPVLAVQKGNPKGLKGVEDLTKPGLKVALPNPEYSTCGEMVFKLLDKKGIREAVLTNVENRLTKGHGDLGTFLKTGVVDTVIMWNGVARTFGDSLDVVPTPYEYDSEIRVHVMSLNYSKKPEQVGRFMEFIRKRAPAVFAEFGYVK